MKYPIANLTPLHRTITQYNDIDHTAGMISSGGVGGGGAAAGGRGSAGQGVRVLGPGGHRGAAAGGRGDMTPPPHTHTHFWWQPKMVKGSGQRLLEVRAYLV